MSDRDPGTSKRNHPVHVDTSAFERAHGRAPRGRGSWAFSWYESKDADKVDLWVTGLYAEAKRAAVARARELGVTCVVVES